MNPFHQFLSFTQRQKRGTLLLILVLLLIIGGPLAYRQWWLPKPKPLSISWYPAAGNTQDSVSGMKPEYFPFNPNDIDSAGMIRMGVDTKTASQWLAYRKAGGIFYEKDDLLRLYAITKQQYLDLEPYIQLERQRDLKGWNDYDAYEKPQIEHVVLNEADSAALEALPGIGPVYANRIIAYRDRIGGFDSVPQLMEVYGIDQTTLEKVTHYMTVGTKPERKEVASAKAIVVELNQADSLQLVALRGIGPVFAKRIMKYRDQLGGFHKVSQLNEVYGLRDKDLSIWEGKLSVDDRFVKKLSLNGSAQEDLAAHPYIGTSVAKFIVSYRLQHKEGFQQLEDLLSSFLVDEKKLEQLRPYLTLE